MIRTGVLRVVRRREALLFGALVVGLTPGCASVVPHRNQPPGVMQGSPRGLYALTSHVRGIGPFTGSTTALIAAEPTEYGFRANSRPGAAGELLGGIEGFFVNLFGDKRVPGGAFLHWSGPAPQDPGPTRGLVRSPRGVLYADLYSLKEPVELRSPDDDRLFGLFTLEPTTADSLPTSDFTKLADRIDAILAEHLFDPGLYDAPSTHAFLAHLRKVSVVARDDAEFLMGWMFASRRLAFSHVYLGRQLDPRFEDRLPSSSSLAPGVSPEAITLTEEDGIATLRIAHFGEGIGDEIDAAFVEVARLDPRGLIIDLRDNPGGTFTASRVAAHLLDAPADGGVFFTRAARAKVLSNRLDEFPAVAGVASVDELLSLLEQHGAIRWRVEPVEPCYSGPVAILINSRVASAAEPLAAGLQESGRATIIGEPTAGAMLSIQSFDVGQGWILSVPTADYHTSNGVRLEGRGVLPDIKAKSEDAPAVARRFLRADD